MLRILQARLQQYMNRDFQMFKLVLEKAEEPQIKLPASVKSSKKQESSRKTKSDTASIVSPSICHEVMELDAMLLIFKRFLNVKF